MSAVRSRLVARRWSLSLIVVMLLHWTFGACAAMADTLCLEASGRVVVEKAGEPCVAAAVQSGEKHCIDLPSHDGHDDHSPVPSKTQLADAAVPGLIPAPDGLSPLVFVTLAMLPDATGPPAPPSALVIRETAYLLI